MLVSGFFALVLAGFPGPGFAEVTVIKTALVTPEGSTWTKVLYEMAAEVEKQTKGEVKFKIYAGGISGDELDVIRKMKANRIHSAGFSGVGMGVILPEFRILEAPLLYNDYTEVDLIKTRYLGRFSDELEKSGYVLLGFAEAGFVHLFSKTDISHPQWVATAKMWAWKGDPVAENFFKALGIKTYPLHLADVNTGLETGMIDSFYSPPLGALVFQWFTKIRYVLDYPMVNSSGALILKKNSFDKLSPENQKILKTLARRHCDRLVEMTRLENQQAMDTMKNCGIIAVSLTPDQIAGFKTDAEISRDQNIPQLYSRDLLESVRETLADHRKMSKR